MSVPSARFDPFDPGLRADPYPVYARFRRDDPVHLGVPPLATLPECSYVFRYEDVDAVLRDPRFGRARGMGAGAGNLEQAVALRRMARQMLLFNDPPVHTRLRGLITRAFAPFFTGDLARRIEVIVHQLLDRAEEEGGLDVMAGYAIPLPVLVIADLMGIPSADRGRFQELSTAVMAMSDVRRDGTVVKGAERAAGELADYLEVVIEERSRRPGGDLISRLIEVEEDGDRLSRDEILANCGLLLIAGHETTRNLIGNGVFSLLSHPAELERLRSEPVLMEGAVHELLRYDSPIQITFRVAKEDLELGGRPIREGQGVALVLGAANRDPEVFTDPDRLDVGRTGARHLAFGGGSHFCLGSPVAVLEATAAIRGLLDRFDGIERAESGDPEWIEHVVFRGLASLPIRVIRAAGISGISRG
jgi:pimeloyl-[acyl-carrier protein] synthase